MIRPQGTAERRKRPRYVVEGSAEIRLHGSDQQIEGRLSDLSELGCQLKIRDAVPTGTVVGIRITKAEVVFEAQGRIVFLNTGACMGVLFTTVTPNQRAILSKWIGQLRENAWLTSTRRKSRRILLQIPLRVLGESASGLAFTEDTKTQLVSAHGALIYLTVRLKQGQRLTMARGKGEITAECTVAHIAKHEEQGFLVGVEFSMPSPMFWGVAFPPDDWSPRHAYAKRRGDARQSVD